MKSTPEQPKTAPAGASRPGNGAPGEGVRDRLRDVWIHRGLFVHFAHRALEKNYTRTKLGKAWLIIRPVMDVITKTLIFGGVLSIPSAGVPYLLFYLVGSSAWRLFDRGVYWGTRAIELNRKLIERLYFPRLLLPAAALIPAAVEFAVYVALFAIALVYYAISDGTFYLELGPQLLVALAGLVLLFVFAGCITLWTSVWGREYRDVRFTTRYVLEFWFFVTPILYPLSEVPDEFRPIAIANPATPLIEMVKWGTLGAGEVHLLALGWSVFVIAVALASGLWYFRRYELASTRAEEDPDDDDWDD